MNKLEVMKLLGIIKGYYPNFVAGRTDEECASMAALWAVSLNDIEYIDACKAVANIAKTLKFAPSIAEICAEVNSKKIVLDSIMRCNVGKALDFSLPERITHEI